MAEEVVAAEATHIVLINEEEQYSLWPKFKAVPKGWKAVGKEGTEEECMKYVDEVWVDMRPRSLREQMDKWRQPGDGDSVQ
jgi:MbtH protein